MNRQICQLEGCRSPRRAFISFSKKKEMKQKKLKASPAKRLRPVGSQNKTNSPTDQTAFCSGCSPTPLRLTLTDEARRGYT